ncbi:hypothetical protein BGM25_03520 [Bacillus sp. FJAT-29953]|nr:hypothetical protein [Bacillus sp. FJAT-29953]
MIESLTKQLSDSPTNWSLREKAGTLLFKQYLANEISEDEYIKEGEVLFREFLKMNPNHVLCKQNLANILQKSILPLDQLLLPNHLAAQEELYRELVSLSTLQRFKNGLANITYLQHKHNLSLPDLLREMGEILYPGHHLEWGKLLEGLNLEGLTDREIVVVEQFFRTLKTIGATEKLFSIKLAEVLCLIAERNQAVSNLPVYQAIKQVKESYSECIRLDPASPLYRQKWLGLLQLAMEQLDGLEESFEVLDQKVEVLFEQVRYHGADHAQIEALLLKQENYLLEHEETLTEAEYNSKSYHVYSRLVKVNPTVSRYKFSLAELMMEKGIGIKTRRKWEEAYRLFQEVLRISPDHHDAVVRMAVIHSYKSEWHESYHLLTSILEKYNRFKRNTKISFCIAFTTVLAHINKIEEAESWLNQGITLDRDGTFGHDSANAKLHIDMCRNFTYYEVHQLGQGSVSMDAATVNKMLQDYEDTRLQSSQEQKIFFDFRDMDIPKIIGPKRTKIIESGNRQLILDYLLESNGPKSNAEINQACFTGEKSPDNIRITIAHIRSEELANVMLGKQGTDPYINNEVLINRGGKYTWAFKGPTYVIK